MARLDANRPLRVAVIGAGRMGSRHALALSRLQAGGDAVQLVGVADLNQERARTVAVATQSVGVTDFRALLPSSDAMIVAVPTRRHFEIVRLALAAGLHVLVEKPCCGNLRQADLLYRLARRRDRVLQVGYLEWFNPAWQRAAVRSDRPWRIIVKRVGPFSPGGADVDVVNDVMIHDIHLIQTWLGEEPVEIDAKGRPVCSESTDIARVRLNFPDGCQATLLASRAAPSRERVWRIYGHSVVTVLDFVAQSAAVTEDGATRVISVEPRDLLESQIQAFVSAVQSRRGTPVQASAVLAAVRTTERISGCLNRCERHELEISPTALDD